MKKIKFTEYNLQSYGINGDTVGFRNIEWYKTKVMPFINSKITQKDKTALVVGVGNGRLLSLYSNKFKKIYAIDPMCEIKPKFWCNNVYFNNYDLMDPFFNMEKVDVILLMGSFWVIYLKFQNFIFHKLYNILKDDGKVMVLMAGGGGSKIILKDINFNNLFVLSKKDIKKDKNEHNSSVIALFKKKNYKNNISWKVRVNKMKLAVCTRADNNIKAMTDLTHPIIKSYAKKWNADFIVLDKVLPIVDKIGNNRKDDLFFRHYRILCLGELLKKYDRILCIDSDVVITKHCRNPFEIIPFGKIGTVCEDFGSRQEDRINRIKKVQDLFGDVGWRKNYINTGFFLCSNIHKDIFQPINNRLWGGKGYDDVNLGYQISRLGFSVYNVSYKWNHMTLFSEKCNNFANRFDSFIVHYAGIGIFNNKYKNRLQQIKADIKVIYG